MCAAQPYAEATLCATADVIFCEDFNYPTSFISVSGPGAGSFTTNWINPGLTNGGPFSFIFGTNGRRINLATTYPTKPQGHMPSDSQADHVWVANWDSALGARGNGATWGKFREAGSSVYANGTTVTKDLYIRFQFYVTADYAWPGDPRTHQYNFGSGGQCFDNKILYVFPPEGMDSPTDSAVDAGAATVCGMWDPVNNARFADGLVFRYGDTGDNFKSVPMCSQCSSSPAFLNYAPYQSLTFRNPNDSPIFGKAFRFNTNRWYTIEFRYQYGSGSNTADGRIQAWINGTLIYDFQNIKTCGGGLGSNCQGLGAIFIGAYHNGADPTAWDGQQVIDNLVISRSYIGPPGQAGPPVPPGIPLNLRLTSP